MKKLSIFVCAALMLVACCNQEKQQNESPDYMTEEFCAVSNYLIQEIAPHYLQGEICVPALTMVATEDIDSLHAQIWGDFWVFWYNRCGDTLKTVSGGNHSGRMEVAKQDGGLVVTAFEQTADGAGYEPSAKRIFGSYYDVYQETHSDEKAREAVRREQLRDYILRHGLDVHYYQDYGWPAVKIEL